MKNESEKRKIIRSPQDSETSTTESEEWGKEKRNLSKVKKKRQKLQIKRNISDSSSDEEEFNDGYDENLIGDEEDRLRLEQMTEKEREQEIFNRLEKREVLKARFDIEKRLRKVGKMKETERLALLKNDKLHISPQHKKNGTKLNNSSFSDGSTTSNSDFEPSFNSDDEGGLKNSNIIQQRSRNSRRVLELNKIGKHNKIHKAIQDLKAKREEKKKALEKNTSSKLKQTPTTKPHLKPSDIYSDDDSTTSSDDAKIVTQSDKATVDISSQSSSDYEDTSNLESKAELITTREQLSKIRLSRNKLEKWVHMPFFEKTVKGCFLRVGIGQHEGKPIYRIVEVMDAVETSKIYQLGATRTNKGLKLRHGSESKVFRLEFVSNSDFTDSEFLKWKDAINLSNISLPDTNHILEKERDIKAALNYSFKEEDVDKIINEKLRFKKNPYNFAMKKSILLKTKEEAESLGDDEKVFEIKQQLEELEIKATELDRLRNSSLSAVSYINQRNRKQNIIQSEKANMEDYINKSTSALNEDDPFTRRKCLPTLVTKKRDDNFEMPNILPSRSIDIKTNQFKSTKHPNTNDLNFTKTQSKTINTHKTNSSLKITEQTYSYTNISKDNFMGLKNDSHKNSTITHDLYEVHNFDIKIDLGIPSMSMESYDSSNIKPDYIINNIANSPLKIPDASNTKKSMNLEDYKKFRGLI
ncbi:unnamed protein product [Gordionus sp. m RMFG-2023]|uniref:RNA polymerase-associated protein RTF1 homolog n=1 Tax=Gordionus sp. m RMFG-2023 TaxID=3053472 RepID=UPI0030E27307